MKEKRSKKIIGLCDDILLDTLTVLKRRLAQVNEREEKLLELVNVLADNAKDIAAYNEISQKDVSELIGGIRALTSIKISELTSLATAVRLSKNPQSY